MSQSFTTQSFPLVAKMQFEEEREIDETGEFIDVFKLIEESNELENGVISSEFKFKFRLSLKLELTEDDDSTETSFKSVLDDM